MRGAYADLSDVSIALTKQMADIINPTTVKTSYSKSLKLPRTTTNDYIYSNYFKLDKLVDEDGFNAIKKTPFRLEINGGDILFQGWNKLDKISDGYETILLSDENKLFAELSEKKLSEISLDLTHKIGRFTIWNGWNSENGIYKYLKYCPSYKGVYDGFNSNWILNNSDTGYTELDNDIDEYTKLEMRSYYQHASVRLQEIIKSIADDNNILLDDDVFFNSNNPYWEKLFMVMPKYYKTDKNRSYFYPTYRSDQAGQGQIITNSSGVVTTNTVGRVHSTTVFDDYDMETSFRLDLSKYPAGTLEIDYEFYIEIEAALSEEIVEAQRSLEYTQYVTPTYYRATSYPDNGGSRFIIKSYITGQNNKYSETMLRYGNYYAFSQYNENFNELLPTLYLKIPSSYTPDNYEKFRFLRSDDINYQLFGEGIQDAWYEALDTKVRIKGKSIINNDNGEVYISFALNGYDASTKTYTTPAFRLINSVYLPNYLAPYYKNTKLRYKVIQDETLRITVKPYTDIFRSNYKLTTENILNPEISQADLLLNYMKLFGLYCFYDKSINKYKIQSRNKFFSTSEKEDWSYKIDKDSIVINPTPIDARKYKLKYTDINSTHFSNYKRVFTNEYSSVLINTGNEFLSNEDVFYDSLFSTPLIEQSYNFYNGEQYRLKWKALSFVSYNGSSRSTPSIPDAPTLLFWDGLQEDSIDVIGNEKQYMQITDDSYYQRNNNVFFWNTSVQSGNTAQYSIQCVRNNKSVFPKFTETIDNASVLFAVPQLTFYEGDTISDDLCIYNRFYEKMMNDKFSVHNRVVEVPVDLTNNDFINFKFNNFYYINDVPYLVTKIIDFNPIKEGKTKVEMLRVLDLNNYISGQSIELNNNRTNDIYINVTTQSVTLTGATATTTYTTPDIDLVSEVGYICNGEVFTSVNKNIVYYFNRDYKSKQLIVKPYVVYNGKTYYGSEYKLNFGEYTATFSNFSFISSGDNYIIELEYSTNMNVKEQGFIINGIKNVCSLSDGVIQITKIQDLYQIIGYIINEDDTYIESNVYLTR